MCKKSCRKVCSIQVNMFPPVFGFTCPQDPEPAVPLPDPEIQVLHSTNDTNMLCPSCRPGMHMCIYNHMWVLICVIRSWKFTRHAGEEKDKCSWNWNQYTWPRNKNIKSLSHRYWLLIHVCKMLLESLPGCNRSTLMVGGIRLIRWLCLRWWHLHQDGWLYALQEYWYQSVMPGWNEVAIMKHYETIDLHSPKN